VHAQGSTLRSSAALLVTVVPAIALPVLQRRESDFSDRPLASGVAKLSYHHAAVQRNALLRTECPNIGENLLIAEVEHSKNSITPNVK
jgi:hypothetical protein